MIIHDHADREEFSYFGGDQLCIALFYMVETFGLVHFSDGARVRASGVVYPAVDIVGDMVMPEGEVIDDFFQRLQVFVGHFAHDAEFHFSLYAGVHHENSTLEGLFCIYAFELSDDLRNSGRSHGAGEAVAEYPG